MSITATISGVIYKINPVEQYGDFRKRVFWVQELNVRYPNTWQLEMWHDDILNLESLHQSDLVECGVTIKGKMVEGKNGGNDYIINILKCDTIKRIG
jgi:hypothetical protein